MESSGDASEHLAGGRSQLPNEAARFLATMLVEGGTLTPPGRGTYQPAGCSQNHSCYVNPWLVYEWQFE